MCTKSKQNKFQESSSSDDNLIIIIGSVLGALLFVIIIFAIIAFVVWKIKKNKPEQSDLHQTLLVPEEAPEADMMSISSDGLSLAATQTVSSDSKDLGTVSQFSSTSKEVVPSMDESQKEVKSDEDDDGDTK